VERREVAGDALQEHLASIRRDRARERLGERQMLRPRDLRQRSVGGRIDPYSGSHVYVIVYKKVSVKIASRVDLAPTDAPRSQNGTYTLVTAPSSAPYALHEPVSCPSSALRRACRDVNAMTALISDLRDRQCLKPRRNARLRGRRRLKPRRNPAYEVGGA